MKSSALESAATLKAEAPGALVPDPRRYADDTAERCLAEWLAAWLRRDWLAMLLRSQKTWRADCGPASPARWIEERFSPLRLRRARLCGTTAVSPVFRRAEADVDLKRADGSLITLRIRPNVIRESAPYSPSASGTWGVNPLSALWHMTRGGGS